MINKKTLKRARFTFMLNDEFNKNGKVSAETFFYNMLPVIEAMK
jgi:hypothetical protein